VNNPSLCSPPTHITPHSQERVGKEAYTLQHTATHCNTLQHTRRPHIARRHLRKRSTHCNTLQYTATHCNTLQHTATQGQKIKVTFTTNVNRLESNRSGFRLNHQATAFSKISLGLAKRRSLVVKVEARSVRFWSVHICGECDRNLLTLQQTARHTQTSDSQETVGKEAYKKRPLCRMSLRSLNILRRNTQYNRLQRTATLCNTLYHTATDNNRL